MIKEEIIHIGKTDKNILGIIMSGSYNTNNFIDGWSDIDLLFVLREIIFKDVKSINNKCLETSQRHSIKIGPSYLTEKEYNSKSCEFVSHKANLIKYNFRFQISKIVFGDIKEVQVDLPKHTKYLLIQLTSFKDRLRYSVRNLHGFELFKEVAKCFQHIILLACLLEDTVNIPSREICLKLFKDFNNDFTIINDVNKWKKTTSTLEEYNNYAKNIFNFSEQFLDYISKRYSNV